MSKRYSQISTAFVFAILLLLPVTSFAELPALDKSPADITYLRKSRDDAPAARVIYSRPQKKSREIFGALVPYGQVWRTGANEATEIEFFKDGSFGGKPVKAGRYSLYTIPNQKSWTVILSSVKNDWGAYKYDEKNDLLRVEAPVSATKESVEAFTMKFDGEPKSGKLIFAWDDTWVEVPVAF